MTHGAHTPLTRARPDQPANLTDQTAGPDPASAKACQPPFIHRHAKALEQAGAHHGELIRLSTHAWAEKKGLPGVAILASAFETSVNILAYEKGRLPVAKLLDELAAGLRRGELPAHGWVLKRLD